MSSYPGGKAGSGISQRIISNMPKHDVYMEPFLGAAAVMMAKRPAAINIGLDLDQTAPGLAWIDCQRQARADLMVDPTIPRAGIAESVAIAGSIDDGGGIRRQVANGSHHHSLALAVSDHRSPDLAVSAELAVPRERTTWIAEVGDGLEYMRSYNFTGREMVYCDPPYLMWTRTKRRLYRYEWDTDQHRQLLHLLVTLPCRVMLSGYPSQLYADHLVGWNSVNYDAMTRGGTTRDEWLWFNFPKPLELHDYRYLGEGYRERERIKKKKKRWTDKLRKMPALERQALLAALQEVEA